MKTLLLIVLFAVSSQATAITDKEIESERNLIKELCEHESQYAVLNAAFYYADKGIAKFNMLDLTINDTDTLLPELHESIIDYLFTQSNKSIKPHDQYYLVKKIEDVFIVKCNTKLNKDLDEVLSGKQFIANN